MARRPLQKKGYLKQIGPSWFLRWHEDVRLADGTIARAHPGRVIAPAEGPGALSHREASRLAWTEILSKLDSYTCHPGSIITLREFIEAKFQPQVINKRHPGGQEHWKTMLGHILPALGAIELRAFSLDRVQRFLDGKAQETFRGRRYSVQTLVHLRNALTRIFRRARNLDLFPTDRTLPTDGVELPAMHRKERGSLTIGQVRGLMAVLDSPVRELVLFLSVTGCRISEALGLRWDRVDFDRAQIVKRETFRRGRWGTLKSDASRRNIPVPDELLAELARLKSRTRWKAPGHPVFACQSTGTPLSAANIQARVLKPKARLLGVPAGVSWHWLRHANSTWLAAGGVNTTDRRLLHGHTSDEMDALYTHGNPEAVRQAMQSLTTSLLKGDSDGRNIVM